MTADFDQVVRSLAAELPFEQARAIWLVDGCGLSYAQAASAMSTVSPEIARIVADARHVVRHGLRSTDVELMVG